MEQFAVAAVAGIAIGIVLLAGRWSYGRLSQSRWRWLADPLTAVICGAAFALLRPFVVDQPTTPLWFVLGVTAVGMLFASATAFTWTLIEGGRKLVELAWADPADPE